jgi:hypothetical protein
LSLLSWQLIIGEIQKKDNQAEYRLTQTKNIDVVYLCSQQKGSNDFNNIFVNFQPFHWKISAPPKKGNGLPI